MGLAEIQMPSVLNKRWVRENEWLASRIDKWVSRCHGYNKLRNNNSLSQEEYDESDWNHPSVRNQNLNRNLEYENIGLLKSHTCDRKDSESSQEKENTSSQSSTKTQTSKRICRHCVKSEMTVDNYANCNNNVEINKNIQRCAPVSRTEIRIAVNNEVISSVDLEQYNNRENCTCTRLSSKCKCLCEKCASECKNIDCVDDNGSLSQDRHRKLIQIMATPIRKLGKHVAPEDSNGKDFQHPISEVAAWRQASNELRSFLSFRRPANHKPARRKRHIVVGGVGANDPVWPHVLLTYERGVSNRPDSPHSLLASSGNRL